MDEPDLFAYMVSVFRALGIPYFVTGSVASGVWGESRMTHDIDVVALMDETMLAQFSARFATDDFYVSDIGALQAVRNGGQFNILQNSTGLKIDVIIPPPSDFRQARFARCREIRDSRIDGCFASPEDVILSKMQFYKMGESDKHLRDIAGIIRLCPIPLDYSYINEWAAKLDVQDIWQAVVDRVEGKKNT